MKIFKTVNIKQVMRYPLTSNYTIHGVSNPTCALHCNLHFNYTTQWNTDVVWNFSRITRPVSDQQNMVLVVVLVWQALFLVLGLLCWSCSGLSETILLTAFSWLRFLQQLGLTANINSRTTVRTCGDSDTCFKLNYLL